jgi:hypothetical protein
MLISGGERHLTPQPFVEFCTSLLSIFVKFEETMIYKNFRGLAIAILYSVTLAQNSTYDVLDYVDQLIGSANGGA